MKINPSTTSNYALDQSRQKSDKVLEMIATGTQERLASSASSTIADRIASEVSAMGSGLMNLNDGISMMQIAGGASTNLSVQSAELAAMSVRYNSASLGSAERSMLQENFNATAQTMRDGINATTYGGQALFGASITLETSKGSVNASLGSLDTTALEISNPESISAFNDQLSRVQSDIGSNTNAMQSSIAALQQNMLSSTAARSQLEDADLAKSINDFKNEELKISIATMTQVHQTSLLQEQMSRLLG
ncbi:MAG: hypothetical protein JXK05_10165 [Campylobacterales bacterium]|nr:hypothetical protein [Campylobacterales bacterium]